VNEFLQQFVIESRELAQAASDGLLALEQSPRDAERLDEVFRAFHTLKGSAAIVEFPGMETAMHAAEEILTEARAGRQPLNSAGIGQCLSRLDQVATWLDAIERSGRIPQDAGARPVEVTPSPAEHHPDAAWVADLVDGHRAAAGRALTAVRFVPGTDCLYHGEDPLERMTSLPGLLALELSAREPWGGLDTLDPFRCNLILTALSAAPATDLYVHLQGHSGECGIVSITTGSGDSTRSLPPHVVGVIEAQQALLEDASPQSLAGRAGSAGTVAANALRFCGRMELSERISHATDQSLLALSVQPLREALAQLLAEDAPAETASADSVRTPENLARTLRIDAGQIDALVRLAGELTVVNNAIRHVAKLARAGDPVVPDLLKDRQGALEHLVAELRRSVVGMRVRPLRAVLQRFPRLVREMSANLGKPVKLVITGEETEADKTIVEMLFEPLLHLVRNAIDHGVEGASGRTTAGKAPTARLEIKAKRNADQVLIEVSDDGAGIDLARLRKAAVARGIMTEERLLTLTEAETLDLVFAPGFSTAARVTEISGRGVGMDAVRRAVERVGGHVSISSVAGQGTAVKLSLPFSVMMTHVMTVEAGGQLFGLPLEAIIEMTCVPQAAISKVGAAPVVVLRDRALPVIDLASVLGVGGALADDDGANLVVATANGECAAFRVDRIVERLDLVLKPLEGLLAGTPGIMGTTLLGDGRVLLVLDVGEILQ